MNKTTFICDHCGAQYDEEGNFTEPAENTILSDLTAYREENNRLKSDLLRMKETLDAERDKKKADDTAIPEIPETPEKPKRGGLLNGIFGR